MYFIYGYCNGNSRAAVWGNKQNFAVANATSKKLKNWENKYLMLPHNYLKCFK